MHVFDIDLNFPDNNVLEERGFKFFCLQKDLKTEEYNNNSNGCYN